MRTRMLFLVAVLAVFGGCEDEKPMLPIMSTLPVSSITEYSATAGGFITGDGGANITARGVVWDTGPNPVISLATKTSNGTGVGSYSSLLTSLTPGTVYYMRAYATNAVGTVYGNEISFETSKILVSVTTLPLTDITATGATSGGSISTDGGSAVTARGVVWGVTTNPTTDLPTKTIDGNDTGTFSSTMSGLLPGKRYFVRAYGTNSVGTAYGNEIDFITAVGSPVLTTDAVNSITSASAVIGGTISSDGGAAISARGVCWSTSANPTIDLSTKTDEGNGPSPNFTSNVTGLASNTTYYARAYATNSAGTGYGDEVSFTTIDLPTLTTRAVANITVISATSGGTISSDGGATIAARGICWGISASPTIDLSTKTANGSGAGDFTSNLVNLSSNTQYYVRAYATNAAGTAYGNEISFTTPAVATPVVTTTNVSNITSSSATSGGSNDSGGALISVRGICWSTSPNPTTALSTKTTETGNIGPFTSSLSGLAPNTTYYVRAYATNSGGTGYGNEVSFTTNP